MTYAPYAAPYWAPEGWEPSFVVSVDIAALSLLPENAKAYAGCIDLAVDHHPSQEFFAAETCLEAESAACGEIIYEIIRELTAVTPEIAPAALCRDLHRHGLLCLFQYHRAHAPHRRGALRGGD